MILEVNYAKDRINITYSITDIACLPMQSNVGICIDHVCVLSWVYRVLPWRCFEEFRDMKCYVLISSHILPISISTSRSLLLEIL